MCAYRVILADDHVMFRQGIKRILEEIDDLEVIAEVGNGLELLELLKHIHPDMVILDITMPGLRGIEATHEIKKSHPDTEVLILTMHKNKEYLYHALLEGAKAYVLKEDADTELLAAINAIRQKKKYISPSLSPELTDILTKLHVVSHGETMPTMLSTRQREVLKLIAEGRTNKEIAALLFISIRTVENHRFNIMHKLDLKTTADLVKYAINMGYIFDPPG